MLPDTVSWSSNGSNRSSDSTSRRLPRPVSSSDLFPSTDPPDLSVRRSRPNAISNVRSVPANVRSSARPARQGPQWWSCPPPIVNPRPAPTGSTQRQHILSTALSLMSQQGVDGTSMRNLATAAGLNVASLYHYFPSKRDLLVAVLEERGFVDDLAAASPPSLSTRSGLRPGRAARRHPLLDAGGGGLRPLDDGRGDAGRRHRLRRGGRPLRRHPGIPRALAGRASTAGVPARGAGRHGPDAPQPAGRPVLRARGRCARRRVRPRRPSSAPGPRRSPPSSRAGPG